MEIWQENSLSDDTEVYQLNKVCSVLKEHISSIFHIIDKNHIILAGVKAVRFLLHFY